MQVNMIKEDGTVIHFNNPKVQASLAANTFAITGQAENKRKRNELTLFAASSYLLLAAACYLYKSKKVSRFEYIVFYSLSRFELWLTKWTDIHKSVYVVSN